MNSPYFIFLVFLATLLCSHTANAGDVLSGPYAAELINVIDGDTFRARIKIWPGQTVETLVRIDGIDTPELKAKCSAEKRRAQHAKDYLEELLARNTIYLQNVKHGKYAGRIVANVRIKDIDISQHFIKRQLAVPYQGKTRKSWC